MADFDLDGQDDLLMTGHDDGGSGTYAGSAWIVTGLTTGTEAGMAWVVFGPTTADLLLADADVRVEGGGLLP